MSVSRDQIVDIVSASVEALTGSLQEQIRSLTQQFEQLNPRVETFEPVTISRLHRGNSLDLVKSLPEFKGESQAYPAWRDAAHFAMEYYPEGTENYYIAMGIFRNKVTGAANAKLSSFNTILNFKAIISRLDQVYADKRSLQSLENELSILRQGTDTIIDFYDKVDQHLTLIINKNKMSYSNNAEVVGVLNERARENALRVFISGLRHPLSDILFSARPSDLPTALATAQELEADQRRQEFARIYATGDLWRSTRVQKRDSNYPPASHPAYKARFPPAGLNVNRNPRAEQPTPMEVDPGSSMFRRPTAHTTEQQTRPQINKRRYEDSGRTAPIQKTPRVNHIGPDDPLDCEEDDVNSEFGFQRTDMDDAEDEITIEELNFLD